MLGAGCCGFNYGLVCLGGLLCLGDCGYVYFTLCLLIWCGLISISGCWFCLACCVSLLDCCVFGCIWFVVGVDLLLIYYLASVDVVGFDCLVWFG